ncbi:C-type lectin lectoxin-Lio2 [Parasteatoda tepidariorum]|uniref:C-type lectin lectoxin-Lio2 n=1 Tax=Parasteatoda tepidariorum TaxID=114398 RepID=UPI001C726938|nr:C-type lection lectoxin-Enh3 [Parasteatoda tepidariorum]
MIEVDTGQITRKKWLLLVTFLIFIPKADNAEKKKCDKPWRTFKNVCFMFSDTNRQKYEEAQTFCYKQGGFLASIRNPSENGFIIKTVQGMGSSYQRVRWFIGLYQYDADDMKAWRWLDGSVSGFRNWMNSQPNSVYERCAMLDGSNGFMWRDEVCTNRGLFICRKELDDQGSMNCFKGKPPPKDILDKKGISVTECLEHCRGLGFTLAGIIPDKCFCLGEDNLKSFANANRLQCSGNCGNQHCGNKDFITIYNLTHYKETADSCEDLSQLGFSSPSTYVTKVGDEEKIMNCFSGDGDF